MKFENLREFRGGKRKLEEETIFTEFLSSPRKSKKFKHSTIKKRTNLKFARKNCNKEFIGNKRWNLNINSTFQILHNKHDGYKMVRTFDK